MPTAPPTVASFQCFHHQVEVTHASYPISQQKDLFPCLLRHIFLGAFWSLPHAGRSPNSKCLSTISAVTLLCRWNVVTKSFLPSFLQLANVCFALLRFAWFILEYCYLIVMLSCRILHYFVLKFHRSLLFLHLISCLFLIRIFLFCRYFVFTYLASLVLPCFFFLSACENMFCITASAAICMVHLVKMQSLPSFLTPCRCLLDALPSLSPWCFKAVDKNCWECRSECLFVWDRTEKLMTMTCTFPPSFTCFKETQHWLWINLCQDGTEKLTTIMPSAGRIVFFTSGSENVHRVHRVGCHSLMCVSHDLFWECAG